METKEETSKFEELKLPMTTSIQPADIKQALHAVKDPEIPTVSLVDLGLITSIEIPSASQVEIKMIPTFTGCPAWRVMKEQVKEKVEEMGFDEVNVLTDHEITWTTNRISEQGLKDIEKIGLSSPQRYCGELNLEMPPPVACPRCASERTALISPFGPTLCRAIHYCNDCDESFEQFKPI